MTRATLFQSFYLLSTLDHFQKKMANEGKSSQPIGIPFEQAHKMRRDKTIIKL